MKHEIVLPLVLLTTLLAWPADAQLDPLNPLGGPFGGFIETLEVSPSGPAVVNAGVDQGGVLISRRRRELDQREPRLAERKRGDRRGSGGRSLEL